MTALARAREIVLRHGWNATAYQILNPGIDLWFSKTREAVVGYREWNRIRVVAGAPICAEADLRDAAAEFEDDAPWTVCYFAAGHRLERILEDDRAYSSISIGAQPIWTPSVWPDILSRHPSLRAQLRRARNKGVGVREWTAERARGDASLRRCLKEWLASRRTPTMHFLIEPDTLDRIWDRRLFAAERDGRAVAFLLVSPVAQRRGWLIEQIVRGSDAPNGTSEILVDAAFRAAAAEGIGYFTLGLVPLSRRAGAPLGKNPFWLDLLFDWTRAHGSRFYNFRGLESFKTKFRPSGWEPIYAISNARRVSPRVLAAIAAVFGGMSPMRFIARTLAHAVRQEFLWLVGR